MSLPLEGLRILLVEDEPLLAEELLIELEALGALPIGPAASVEAALQLISEEAIDAALCNVYLRGELSFPVADALLALGVPFLFVTGNDAFVREHYPDVPSEPKPSDMPKLVAALSQLMSEIASSDASSDPARPASR